MSHRFYKVAMGFLQGSPGDSSFTSQSRERDVRSLDHISSIVQLSFNTSLLISRIHLKHPPRKQP
jgi:hypothetical protein